MKHCLSVGQVRQGRCLTLNVKIVHLLETLHADTKLNTSHEKPSKTHTAHSGANRTCTGSSNITTARVMLQTAPWEPRNTQYDYS